MTEMWPAGRTARLHDLVQQGLSSAAIGREMDVTKNVVIGKCRRMGYRLTQPNHVEKRGLMLGRPLVVRHVPVVDGATLPALASAVAARKTPQPVPAQKAPEVPVAPPEPAPPRCGKGATCCWPIGDPGTRGFRFCEAAAVSGKPYCATHVKIAYVRRTDLRDERDLAAMRSAAA